MITRLSHWRDFFQASPLRRLGLSSLLAASAAVVAKGVGFVKEIVVAASFGLADGLDVYLLAFVLIGFPLSILLNAVQAPLVSALATGEHSQDSEGELFTRTLVRVIWILALALPVWLWILHQTLPWFSAGFDDAKRATLWTCLLWLVPYYLFNTLNLLGYNVLQAKHRFVANGLLPSLTAVVTICIVLIADRGEPWQILSLALVIGTGVESLCLYQYLIRAGLVRFPAKGDSPHFDAVMRGCVVLLPGTAVVAVGPVVEQSIAASLGSGVVAAIGYGYRLPAALSGIVVTAVGITILPHFTAMLRSGDLAYCRASLYKWIRWLLFGGLILALTLSFFSREIIHLFFQRGAFDLAAVDRVSPIQQVYFLQLPGALVAITCLRALSAMNANAWVSVLTASVVVLQSILVWVWGRYYGAVGIAAAVTAGSTVLAVLAFISVKYRLGRITP